MVNANANNDNICVTKFVVVQEDSQMIMSQLSVFSVHSAQYYDMIQLNWTLDNW